MFVHRTAGAIVYVGFFQAGYAEEELADDDAGVVAFLAAALPPPQPTPREWLERLSADKQAFIAAAGATSGPILLWLLKAAGSPFIDVTLPETIAGVGALVTAGIITTADETLLLTP